MTELQDGHVKVYIHKMTKQGQDDGLDVRPISHPDSKAYMIAYNHGRTLRKNIVAIRHTSGLASPARLD